MVETLAYAGEVPWHQKGRPLSGRTTATDMLDQAGLNWTVVARPVHITLDPDGPVYTREVPGYKAITRVEDGSVLSVQSDNYGIVQNQLLADLAEAMAGGMHSWEVGGSLQGGRKVFLCGVVDESEIAGDRIVNYLTLASSHDGELAVTAARTPTRVVCANTLAVMLAQAGARPRITIPHSKNAAARVKLATRLVEESRAYFGAFRDEALTLVAETMSVLEAHELAQTLIPEYKSEDTGRLVVPALQTAVVELFKGQREVGIDRRIAGTRWGFFQALTAALDHNRKGSDDGRLRRFLAGSDDTLRSRAWRLLTGKKGGYPVSGA